MVCACDLACAMQELVMHNAVAVCSLGTHAQALPEFVDLLNAVIPQQSSFLAIR